MRGEDISIPAAKHIKYSLFLSAHSLFLYITQIPMLFITMAPRAKRAIQTNVFCPVISSSPLKIGYMVFLLLCPHGDEGEGKIVEERTDIIAPQKTQG
jgi:hypothetical protein